MPLVNLLLYVRFSNYFKFKNEKSVIDRKRMYNKSLTVNKITKIDEFDTLILINKDKKIVL